MKVRFISLISVFAVLLSFCAFRVIPTDQIIPAHSVISTISAATGINAYEMNDVRISSRK